MVMSTGSANSNSVGIKFANTQTTGQTFYMGVELESFINKDDTIESGANVLNNNIRLHFYYKNVDATNSYNLVFFAPHMIFPSSLIRKPVLLPWNVKKNAEKSTFEKTEQKDFPMWDKPGRFGWKNLVGLDGKTFKVWLEHPGRFGLKNLVGLSTINF